LGDIIINYLVCCFILVADFFKFNLSIK